MKVKQIAALAEFARRFGDEDWIEVQTRRTADGPGTTVVTARFGSGRAQFKETRWIDCRGKMYNYDPDPVADQVVYWLSKYRERGAEV